MPESYVKNLIDDAAHTTPMPHPPAKSKMGINDFIQAMAAIPQISP
jgi:hypothetical protein